jgi:hypothetical protein
VCHGEKPALFSTVPHNRGVDFCRSGRPLFHHLQASIQIDNGRITTHEPQQQQQQKQKQQQTTTTTTINHNHNNHNNHNNNNNNNNTNTPTIPTPTTTTTTTKTPTFMSFRSHCLTHLHLESFEICGGEL